MTTVQHFRTGQLRVVVAPAAMFGVVLHGHAPQTTADTVREIGRRLYAAVDGPMFDFASSERNRTYAAYHEAKIRFRHYYPARFVDEAGAEPSRGLSFFVANGVSGAEPGAGSKRPGETFRVQTYPSLVIDGVMTQGLTDTDTANRPVLGRLSDGRMFLALGAGINMPDLARAMAILRVPGSDARVTHAGYLDGGGSAAMYVDVELDGVAEEAQNLAGRRVVSWITVEDKPSGLIALGAHTEAAIQSLAENHTLLLAVSLAALSLAAVVAVAVYVSARSHDRG